MLLLEMSEATLLCGTVAQLTLRITAPAIHVAVIEKSACMVVASINGDGVAPCAQ